MSFTALQDSAKVAAMAILENASSKLARVQEDYAQHFGKNGSDTLAAVQAKYSAAITTSTSNDATSPLLQSNADCQAAILYAIQLTDSIASDLTVLEQYITWNIPKMEDGNNFGVTVQLAALKHLTDVQDKVIKNVDELLKYASQRADVLEKCKQLPSTVNVTTQSTGKTQSQGGKDGDGTESKTSQEDKTTTTVTQGIDAAGRLQALVAVDCNYWYKAKVQVQALVTGYVAALDFLEKNATKIAQPKGSQAGGHFSSMY